MRNFILLCSAIFFSIGVSAQDTIYHENFDAPSGPDSVTNSNLLFIPSSPPTPVSEYWDTTTFLSTSGNASYHVDGYLHNEIMFTTDTFSTVGFPYVFLNFNHIAKLYLANTARIEYTTDGGVNWNTVDATGYTGTSALFIQNNYFNEGAYIVPSQNIDLWESSQNTSPQQSWWVAEKFDMRGQVYDTINNVGFAHVQLRFVARFLLGNPTSTPSNQVFHAGWFIDDVEVIRSVCELDAPVVSFVGISGACIDKPEGAVVQDPSNSYVVTVKATDKGAGIDRVELHYENITTNFIDTLVMPLVNIPQSKYSIAIPNVALGDTVEYHVEAFDLSCPNMTRLPNAFVPDVMFYVDSGFPAKCGAPYCGNLPSTIKVDVLPWTETFEGPGWSAGNNGSMTTNNGHRGSFPVYPDDYWVIAPPSGTVNSGKFAWCVANGPTATAQTGPDANHTPGGSKYLYTEGSLTSPIPSTNISPASIFTPCIDLTSNTKCLAFEFYYHMFGSDMGSNATLRIDIDTASGSEPVDLHLAYSKIVGEQHTSGSDPWKRGVISLEQFNGQFIRIRIVAFKFGSGSKYDMAVDDFKIYEPDPVDIELVSYVEPLDGFCSYSNNETVKIQVRNNGCTTTGTIPISFQVDQNPVVNTSITAALGLGEDTIIALPVGADLSSFGIHTIKVWSNATGDADNSNDTVTGPQIEHNPSITTFPYFEDFEGGTVGTQNIGNTNWRFDDGLDPTFKWQIGNGLTSTRNTGPYQGYYNGGNYLYTESGNSMPNVSTYLRTLCLDLTNLTQPTLDFFYHMYGADIGTLQIQVSQSNQNTWTTLNGSTVSATNTAERTDWKFQRVSLTAYAGSVIKLRFKANRNGTSDRADIAIDEISIYDRTSTDAGAYLLTLPGTGVPIFTPTAFPPVVSIINYGTSTLVNPKVNIEVTPLCPGNPQTSTFTETISGSITAGSQQSFTLNNINVAWPQGTFLTRVYTDVTGDGHSFNDTIERNIIGLDTFYIPFADNFDNCSYSSSGFVPQGTFLQWELGQPQVTNGTVRTPRSSPNIWATDLDGPFLPGTEEILVAPLFDEFDTVVKAEIRFYQNFDFSTSSPETSAGVVEFFGNGQWKALGGDNINANIGVNWYGSKYGTQNSAVFGGPAFVGTTLGQWIYTSYPLINFNQSTAILRPRFRFKSTDPITAPINKAGWGIDDFEVHIPGQNSASPIAARTIAPIPFPGQDQQIEVTILNTGAKILDSCIIEVYIDNISAATKIADINTFYRMKNFMFTGEKDKKIIGGVWPGSQVTSGEHNIIVITSRPNNKADNIPFDDTLDSRQVISRRFKIIVPDEIDITAGGIDEMCNDFEGTSGYSPWFTKSSVIINNIEEFESTNSSWENGSPTQFGAAHSGTNAWTTRLDSNYQNFERSSLFSPIFIMDSGQVYSIDFWHWVNTEQYHDGGNVEVTFDGGQTWIPIGYKIAGKPWYNTDFVTSLEIIKPGWTGDTKGWINSKWNVMFQDNLKGVFRFRFGSDAEITRPGWSVDDFCFSKEDSLGADQVIGDEEVVMLPNDVVVATLAPNPTQGISELALYAPTPKNANLIVVNAVGQLMEQRTLTLEDGINRLTFDGSRWDAGMYIIKLQIEDEVVTRKLIISH